MKIKTISTVVIGMGLIWAATTASAAVIYDQDVTNEVIFGSGNANGAFTVDQQNGLELGLRAKLRFDQNNLPQNTFNSNGDGTYRFDNVAPPSGFGFAPNSPSTAIWNFEWSINSNFDGSGASLDSFNYLLQIDFDPSAGTNFLAFDPINSGAADHALGDNTTANGAGISDPTNYAANIASLHLAQNSWNMEFFDGGPYTFNALDAGIYDIVLTAYDGQTELASTSIQVINASVPEPQTLFTMSLALCALGWMRRKRSAA
ncbi:PEP-CTERM sorting domain-containing protein [Agarivorans sp. MS3-6]